MTNWQSKPTEVAKGAPMEFNGDCVATFAWFISERQGVSWYCDSFSFDCNTAIKNRYN